MQGTHAGAGINARTVSFFSFALMMVLSLTAVSWGATVVNPRSGKCVDVAGAGTGPGTPLIQYSCNGNRNQDYLFNDQGDGTYSLEPTHANGMCVEANGLSLFINNCNGQPQQRFQNQVEGDGTSHIKSADGSMCFNVSGNSTDDLASIILWPCDSELNEIFVVSGSSLPVPSQPQPQPQSQPQPQPPSNSGNFQKGINGGSLLNAAFTGDVGSVDSILDDYSNLGVRWIRVEFQWNTIQPGSPSNFVTGAHDLVISHAVARGFRILGLIDYSNGYANGGQDQNVPPGDVTAFGSYAGLLASHFGPMGVHDWEIYNEENLAKYWLPGVDNYYFGRLLQSAYGNIKSNDGGATVVLGGFSEADDNGGNQHPLTFLQGIYNNGFNAYFDAIAMHPYAFTGDSYWQVTILPALYDMMSRHGEGYKKIWITEVGATTPPDNPQFTEQWQSDMIAGDFARMKNMSFLGPIFLFDYKDAGTDPGNNEDHFGLLRIDNSRKPAYWVFQAQ